MDGAGQARDTHVKTIREVKPECVGDDALGEAVSAGLRGGVAVDVEARAAAEEAAVSSLSSSTCFLDGETGEERRPSTVGE